MSIQNKKNPDIIDTIPLKGPFKLCKEEIELYVKKQTAGNFLLGYVNINDGLFYELYSGHTDNIHKTLTKLIRYFSHFKFIPTESLQEAFINDCTLYHFYNEKAILLNVAHPSPPEGNGWRCSVCGKDRAE